MDDRIPIKDLEQINTQVAAIVKERHKGNRPDAAHYRLDEESKSVRFIADAMLLAKAIVPIIAVAAGLASSIRTMQTIYEIYAGGGVAPVFVWTAAIAFTLSVEVAIFVLALAHEAQQLRWRSEQRRRRVISWRSLVEWVEIRMGRREPLRYDELPETDGLGLIMSVAFMFALGTNAYLGLRPLVVSMSANGGEVSLSTLAVRLASANATLQMQFFIELLAAAFPPFMAKAAGHLTARYAAEIAERPAMMKAAYDRDLRDWTNVMKDPLATPEAQELIDARIAERIASRNARPLPSGKPVEPSGNTANRKSYKRNNNAPADARKYLQDHPEVVQALLSGKLSMNAAWKASKGSIQVSHEAFRQEAFKLTGLDPESTQPGEPVEH